jgi:hypothetical protein
MQRDEGGPAVGVESDQLVFDYLSRVGDLAQTALPAAQRMRLVTQLRNDIDRERRGSDNTATVRRILGRIGSPDEVVEAAAGTAGPAYEAPPAEPPPGSYGPYAKQKPAPKRPSMSKGGPADGEDGPQVPTPRRGRDAAGDDDAPDWWRVGPNGGRTRAGDELLGLPGMTGGVFIPFDDEELAEQSGDRPVPRRRLAAPEADETEEAAAEYEEETAARPRRRLLPRGRGWGSPVLLLAAALLVAGAVLGSWIPLLLGWLAGYLSRRLTRTQAKFAVLGIPGAAAAGLLVWVWGRDTRKWGEPIAQGQMGHAFQDALPTAVRAAAVTSALYLLWRARRTA